MARYSVATTKDNLSSLIDKALAGEEVIITRHGKPVVELTLATERTATNADIYERIRKHQEALPMQRTSYLEHKQQEDAEGAL